MKACTFEIRLSQVSNRADVSPDNTSESTLDLIQQMLEIAAQGNQTHVVQFILKHYPNTVIDETTVRYAAQNGSVDLYMVLLWHDPLIIDMDFNDGREFPITVALNMDKNPVFIRFLLSSGANPNVRFFDSLDCLALATRSKSNALELCTMLIEHGAAVKASPALATAARRGHLDVVKYLLQQGAEVNNLSNDRASSAFDFRHNWSALHNAITEGHLDVAVLLLDQGADPYVLDREGRTALQIARAIENRGITDMLEARGINEHRESESP